MTEKNKARIKVFLTEPIHPEAQAKLEKHVQLDIGSDSLNRDEICNRVRDANVILSKTDPIMIDAELINAASGLKLIARHGSGYSNVDVELATRNGIAVTNAPGMNATSVAEFTLALMLMLARNLPRAIAACREGAPDRLALKGQELNGKTFGVIGVGQAGRHVAHLVWALGMRVLAYHPRPSASRLAELPLQLVGLGQLLEHSDVISLHVPLNAETRNLIGARELSRVKSTAILLNLSRGGVVDEKALYDALLSKRLFAAATDVLLQEPARPNDPLLGLDNCLVTPHIAALTEEAQHAVAMAAVDEVIRFSRGQELRHVVNPSVLKRPHD